MSDSRQVEVTTPLGKDAALLFGRMYAREELGRLFEYQLELRGPPSQSTGAADFMGKSVTVSMQLAGSNTKRHFNGIVTRFMQGARHGRFFTYHLELRPRMWLLTRNAGCRIFENRSVVQILETVFGDYGFPVDKRLKASYPDRVYCVQYRETDFNFVSRLMEEEGIYYYFTHKDGAHTLVLCDNASSHDAIPNAKLKWKGEHEGGSLTDNILLEWNEAHSLQPQRFTHAEFEFQTPSARMTAEAKAPAGKYTPPKMEIYDYPGLFDALPIAEPNTGDMVKEGSRLAEVRQAEFVSQQIVASGLVKFRPMAVGGTFEVEGGDPDQGNWLVTAANYELDFGEHESAEIDAAAGFVCRLQAVPKKVRYQPARITPRPFVQGPQTALVTSGADKKGVDKFGRVKVRFPWVRANDKQQDSCWVRVSQGWASKKFGMMALPRVDDEVVVSFLEGDPDRPLVTGRVYNADSMPPYPLPDQATTTGILSRSFDSTAVGDSNELRFDDKAGAEHLWLQAQRDYNLNVRNDATTTIGNNVVNTIGTNVTTSIGSNSALTIGQAASVTIGADTHLDVATDAIVNLGGAMQLNIGSLQQTNVSGNASLTVGANTEINTGAIFNVTAGAAMNIVAAATLVIDAGAMLTLKVGGSTIIISEAGVDITGKMVNINCGGGGAAGNKAQKVNPPKPKKAEKPAEHKDPIKLQTAGKKAS